MLNPEGRIRELDRRIEVLAARLGLTVEDLDAQYPDVQAERLQRKSRKVNGQAEAR